ncbi:DUF1317 family protein [Escherichia coli]|uniref:DUF1317 family protein n=5 Tax=Enterobacteriaceae TaxID=543 RepID=UPI00092EFD8D|nr:DUF1317 family protein [Escherichia coli]
MKHPHDNIRVGAITFVYSVTKRGWVFPGLSVIRNPLKAQRLAEEINNKRGAVCHERCNSDPHPTPEIRSRG